MNFIITQEQVSGIWDIIKKIPTEAGLPIFKILESLRPEEQKAPEPMQQPITEG